MSQSNLFDKPAGAMARKSDPIESHEAATDYTASGKLSRDRRRALLLVAKFPGRNTREISDGDGNLNALLHKRLPDLERMGLARPQSWKGGRKWWLTELGRATTTYFLEKE